MNQSFTSPEILGLSLWGNVLMDAVPHRFKGNWQLKGFPFFFFFLLLCFMGFSARCFSSHHQYENAERCTRKKDLVEPISVTNTHKLQVAPELCIEAQLLGSVGPALTAAMSQVICHHTWRVGSREGGSVPALGGLVWIRALSCHPRKLWSWKWSLCSPTRRMKRNQERCFLLCWQPLIRGEPLVSQLGARLLPLQQGQAGSLCTLLQVSIKVFSISSAHLKS